MIDGLLRRTVLLLVVCVVLAAGARSCARDRYHSAYASPGPSFGSIVVAVGVLAVAGLFAIGVVAQLVRAIRAGQGPLARLREAEERRARRSMRAPAEDVPPFEPPEAPPEDPDPALDEEWP